MTFRKTLTSLMKSATARYRHLRSLYVDSGQPGNGAVRQRKPAILGGHVSVTPGGGRPAGYDQDIRRRTIIDHLGLRDVTVLAADHLPLAPDGPRTVERAHS
jgi:hypothetical protein